MDTLMQQCHETPESALTAVAQELRRGDFSEPS